MNYSKNLLYLPELPMIQMNPTCSRLLSPDEVKPDHKKAKKRVNNPNP